ncbi:hypothetical protein ACHAXT_009786 [Thalassiosira profunda]
MADHDAAGGHSPTPTDVPSRRRHLAAVPGLVVLETAAAKALNEGGPIDAGNGRSANAAASCGCIYAREEAAAACAVAANASRSVQCTVCGDACNSNERDAAAAQ